MQSSRESTDLGPGLEAAGTRRRGFLSRIAAVVVGSLVALVPMAAGLLTFFDPLRSRAKGGGDGRSNRGRLVRVAPLDALSADGVPRQFQVIADRFDAWNRFPDESIGVVYLRRVPGSDEVQAFNATCPHLGCFVSFKADRGMYQCPCHESAFKIDGAMIHPTPSPRDLDELETKVKDNAVWVWYQDFYTGKEQKKPKT
ncbi:MAG: Rieske 2Fe-2S domain-containing protein [Pirellulales bacterium]